MRPAARPEGKEGLRWLPDGDLVYDRSIHRYTTLPMQAGEIHEIGLQQIARLADEYRAIGADALGTTDLQEIFSRLRDDPELHHTTGEGVRAAAETAFDKARAAMGDWFGRLPAGRLRRRGDPVGSAGVLLPGRRRRVPPGHVLRQHRRPDVLGHVRDRSRWPSTRASRAITCSSPSPRNSARRSPSSASKGLHRAYAEGWGLYTERLADEMGLYGSPLERMGMLSADSMRAGRLVVDTGMHALGWSRHEAIEYFADNSPSQHALDHRRGRPLHRMPGQALSYMIGRLEIQRMRADAEAPLGTASTSRASTTPSSAREWSRSRRSTVWWRSGSRRCDKGPG